MNTQSTAAGVHDSEIAAIGNKIVAVWLNYGTWDKTDVKHTVTYAAIDGIELRVFSTLEELTKMSCWGHVKVIIVNEKDYGEREQDYMNSTSFLSNLARLSFTGNLRVLCDSVLYAAKQFDEAEAEHRKKTEAVWQSLAKEAMDAEFPMYVGSDNTYSQFYVSFDNTYLQFNKVSIMYDYEKGCSIIEDCESLILSECLKLGNSLSDYYKIRLENLLNKVLKDTLERVQKDCFQGDGILALPVVQKSNDSSTVYVSFLLYHKNEDYEGAHPEYSTRVLRIHLAKWDYRKEFNPTLSFLCMDIFENIRLYMEFVETFRLSDEQGNDEYEY